MLPSVFLPPLPGSVPASQGEDEEGQEEHPRRASDEGPVLPLPSSSHTNNHTQMTVDTVHTTGGQYRRSSAPALFYERQKWDADSPKSLMELTKEEQEQLLKYGYPTDKYEPDNEQDRLACTMTYGILDSPPEECFVKICEIACKLLKVPNASINIIMKDTQVFFTGNIPGGEERIIPRGESVCTHTINYREPLLLYDLPSDERFKHRAYVSGDHQPHMKVYLGAPITTSEHHNIGAFCAYDIKPRPDLEQNEDIKTLMEYFAIMVRDQLELRRLAHAHLAALQQKGELLEKHQMVVEVLEQGVESVLSPSALLIQRLKNEATRQYSFLALDAVRFVLAVVSFALLLDSAIDEGGRWDYTLAATLYGIIFVGVSFGVCKSVLARLRLLKEIKRQRTHGSRSFFWRTLRLGSRLALGSQSWGHDEEQPQVPEAEARKVDTKDIDTLEEKLETCERQLLEAKAMVWTALLEDMPSVFVLFWIIDWFIISKKDSEEVFSRGLMLHLGAAPLLLALLCSALAFGFKMLLALRYFELKNEKEELRHELFSDYDPSKLQLSEIRMRKEGEAKKTA
ncbi:unnamed protein product [Vitrella brassicaformis CCMP3155]|uniref:GAF domain-containing protein n=2 Tax=Vitrella brassicaformis TaxID=1169539 RepID=A0A0G4ETC0_VITBC|nr:unnamed protein product [Vitrella brassicaformis CCMP3155]|eukprot:CEM01853.1 unnamed protein product [Vitrella brassicaformis CCMP3155]